MAKQTKAFTFNFPLTHKVVRNCREQHEHLGDLEISGYGYFNPRGSVLDVNERYSCDIDHIRFNGTNIKPVLEYEGGFLMDEIFEAAGQHVMKLFEDDHKGPEPQPERSPLFEQLAAMMKIQNQILYGL